MQEKQKDLKDYGYIKMRHLKRQELETLLKAKANNEMDIKQYLLKKKEIKEQLFSYDCFLKGTKFEDY
jgi:hypothetical protein